VRFDVLTEARMTMMMFCVVTLCRLVSRPTVQTEVSEKHTISIFRTLTLKMETAFLRNADFCLALYMASQPRKTTSPKTL
jgi:hypothetical protein